MLLISLCAFAFSMLFKCFFNACPLSRITQQKLTNVSSCKQFWLYSKSGEIRRDEACLDYAGTDVILYPCHGAKGNQYWEYDPQVTKKYLKPLCNSSSLCRIKNQTHFVQHGSSKNCLAISEDKKKIAVERCSDDNPRVKWKFEKYDPSKKI